MMTDPQDAEQSRNPSVHFSMYQAENPIHYRLVNEEWVQAARTLKPAELKILYYLRTLDPYGDRELDIGVRELAAVLGMNPSSASRALKVLDQDGWIDLELTRVNVRVHSKTHKTQVLRVRNTVAPTQQSGSVRNTVACTQQSGSVRNTSNLKPSQDKGSGDRVSYTNKTLNKTKDSLSDPTPPQDEREPVENLIDPQNEAFRNWLREKAKQLPNPPQFLEAWVEKQAHKESFQREFLSIRKGSVQKNVPRDPPDRFQLESACEQAHEAGDRPYLRSRLQQLWQQGFTELIEELCQAHPEWNVCVTGSGVQEVDDADG